MVETQVSPFIATSLQNCQQKNLVSWHPTVWLPGGCGFSPASHSLLAAVWGNEKDVSSVAVNLGSNADLMLLCDLGQDT